MIFFQLKVIDHAYLGGIRDIGKINQKNELLIYGRNDDVINVKGHRIGTGEIESVVLQIDDIIEVCAVPVPDNLEGNRICIFLV